MRAKNKAAKGPKQFKNADHLFHISKLSNEALLDELKLQSFGEVKSRKQRVQKFGFNLVQKKRFAWWKIIFEQLYQPFNLVMMVLITLDLIAYFVINKGKNEFSDLISSGVSFVILSITFSTALIEGRNSHIVDLKTNDVIANHFSILRHEIENVGKIHFEALQKNIETITYGKITIGDVIVLKPGDIIPADMRIIWENGFSVDDSFIRGYVQRVNKKVQYTPAEKVFDLANIVLSQSIVTDGYAFAVVVAIGRNRVATSFSKMVEKESTAFYHRGLKKITFFVLLSVLIIFPISLCSVYFSATEKGVVIFVESIMYAITIVVALIPESLPAVIAFNLQHGNRHIQNKDVIVKNVEAVQDLGAVDVFISNKTGPITKDRPILINWVDANNEKSENVLNLAFLNAYFQTSLYFHFEQAILEMFEESKQSLTTQYELVRPAKIGSIKRDGSIVIKKDDVLYQITVTSFDNIKKDLRYFNDQGTVKEIDENKINQINRLGYEYVASGFRPLAVASKIILNDEVTNNDDLMFEGILIFKDQIRNDVLEALIMFKKYNIDFKILSGDNADVVKYAAHEIGLEEMKILTGDDISKMSPDELKILLRGVNVFAKMSPIQKSLIIHNYVKNNEVVAYIGDGINDALAIKKADVGIAPNSSTPLAKKFADIIAVDKNLTHFDSAIRWGRITFLNTLKFIKLTITTNLGLFFALLISGIWFPFFPLSSIELLIQNLFIDFANIAFMTDRVSENTLRKPVKWRTNTIVPFVLINAITPALISILNLVIICYGFGWFQNNLDYQEYLAQKIETTFYIESFTTRIVMIFVLRTEKILLWKDLPHWKFITPMLVVGGFVILIPYLPTVGALMEMVPPTPIWWAVMCGNVALGLALGTGVKWMYQKIFKSWF